MKRWTAGLVVAMIALTAASGLACEVICPADATATETESCHQASGTADTSQLAAAHVCDHDAPAAAMTLVKRTALDSAPAATPALAPMSLPTAAAAVTLAASARAPADPPTRSVTVLRI